MGCQISKSAADADDVYEKASAKEVSTDAHFDDSYFTQQQKQIILETWDQVNTDRIGKGTQIFSKIFEKKPEAKDLFPFRHLSGDELLSNHTFRFHARRFMDAIGLTVQHLDALDVSCAPSFVTLGRKHVWIADFKTSGVLDVFISSIAEVFEDQLPDRNHADVHDAWRRVFTFIVNKLCEGYDEAHTSPRNTNGLSTPDTVDSHNHVTSLSEQHVPNSDAMTLEVLSGDAVARSSQQPSPINIDHAVVPVAASARATPQHMRGSSVGSCEIIVRVNSQAKLSS